MQVLVPVSQRRGADELDERLDLSTGDSAAKRSAFWIMLTLSGVIAVAGVVGDSTATVIGAMIVAPLSTPILGVGLGITSGRIRLVGQSLAYVTAGVALVVLLGLIFAQVLPNPTNVLTNSQVVGRTSPTLTDLTAALATGLVGAIAITRRDVGDVLPGVAIAISLVPPLAVVGVCLGSGAPALAVGAMVLFASNVLAMILTATLIFVVCGYVTTSDAGRSVSRGRAYTILGVALVAVAVPMVVNSLSSLWASQVATAARQWLDDSAGAEVQGVSWHGGTATITVLGPGELPSLDTLQRSVDELLPWNTTVVVVHTVGERLTASE